MSSFLKTSARILFSRILPAIVFLVAIFIGWLTRFEHPLGVVFATVFPLMNGKLPATIVGHGKMQGTPEVPVDLMPQPRPANEMFLTLPGDYLIPQTGLGMCCRYSAYDDVLVRRTVLWFLLLGGRHIDGADIYLNHEAIGLGIQDAIARGIPRDEIFVTTKLPPTHFGYNRTLESVPRFLKELHLDYIDLVLMHAPGSVPIVMPSSECGKLKLTKKECRQETWKALSILRDQGLIRNAGVSNFAKMHLQDLQELSGVAPIAMNQFQYNPWAPEFIQETYNYCMANNIHMTAYASLGGSLQHAETTTVETLQDIASSHSKTLAQVLLRWALQKNMAVIPGTGSPEHMKENLDVYSFSLSEKDMDRITQLASDEGATKFFYMKPPSE